MKIRVTLTVEIDAKAWADNYGVDPEDVRNDVRQYILTNVQGSAGIEEAHGEVTL
jgi:hypothetical protein